MTVTSNAPAKDADDKTSTVTVVLILVVAILVIGGVVLRLGGAQDPPPYTGLIEKVSPGGQLVEMTIENGGATPCIGVVDSAGGTNESVCGPLDLIGTVVVNGEEFAVARVARRIDQGAESLGDCVRTAEATIADGSYAYWCMRG